jgi:NADH-quinone oxidoreductase subunit M
MWLPEAHVEAPTAGSILLAGILLKLGGYGIIFFMLPFFNNFYFLPLIYTLTLISIFYSSFILFRETHLKKIIAYSSIIHMNIGILGLFSNNIIGITGGIFMMFSHGFISSGLFFCSGVIFNRFKSYDITTIKNLSTSMPKLTFLFIILIFGNMGLPLTSGFIGEFLVLYGLFKHNFFITCCILISLLLNTIYNILLMTRLLYGNFIWPVFFNKKF